MLDSFLKVAYDGHMKKESRAELEALLAKLPESELRKLASGTPISKLAHFDYDEKETWLDKFKGSPLFEQALALEQEKLQVEVQEQQQEEQRRALRQQDQTCEMRDKIDLKKKLLELELAKSQAGVAPAQGAGAPGDVPAEGVQDNAQGLQGGVAKAASFQDKVAFAEGLGRALAHSDFAKAAHANHLLEAGGQAGELLAKEALNLGAIGGMISKAAPAAQGLLGKAAPFAQKALGAVAKNPALAGAAVGAAGGALAGGPGHRMQGAMGGAALGGAAGHLGAGAIQQNVGKLQRALPARAGFAAPPAAGSLTGALGNAGPSVDATKTLVGASLPKA